MTSQSTRLGNGVLDGTPRLPKKQGSVQIDPATRALSQLLARRLIQRRDTKALQGENGAYSPVRDDFNGLLKFTVGDVALHLSGRATFGHYVVDQAGLCRILAFDVDFPDEYMWRGAMINPRTVFGTDHPARKHLNAEIRGLADGLAWRLKRRYGNLTVATAFSGSKGIHVYGMFENPTTAQTARELALDTLESFGCFSPTRGKSFFAHDYLYDGLSIEVFPKQEQTGNGGFGNLLRLPLGVNRKTMRRAFFYDPRTEVHDLKPSDPIKALMYGTVVPA